MTDETTVKAAIAAERLDLAEVLTRLQKEDWDAPSLCEGWRVREVVAHITMPFRYSVGRFIIEMLKARGSYNRMADRCARQDASSLSSEELLGSLRDNSDHPWKPPGGGFHGALSHDVIHGMDITVALGIDRRIPLDRVAIVLGGLKPKTSISSASIWTASSFAPTTSTGPTVRGSPFRVWLRICCWCCAVASCRRDGSRASTVNASLPRYHRGNDFAGRTGPQDSCGGSG